MLAMRFYLGLKNDEASKDAPKLLISSKLDMNIRQLFVEEDIKAVDEILWWLNKALAYSDSYQGKCTRWVQIKS